MLYDYHNAQKIKILSQFVQLLESLFLFILQQVQMEHLADVNRKQIHTRIKLKWCEMSIRKNMCGRPCRPAAPVGADAGVERHGAEATHVVFRGMCGDEDGGRLQHLSCPPPQRGRGCSFQLECDVMRRRGQEACGLAAARADGERFTRSEHQLDGKIRWDERVWGGEGVLSKCFIV